MTEIENYIKTADRQNQDYLKTIYQLIKDLLPDCQEKISYGMPTFWKGRNIIHFAAQKKHLGIYPGSGPIVEMAELFDQAGITYSKGTIQFPYNQELPLDLITELIKVAYKVNHKG